jgi:hypothetical protein
MNNVVADALRITHRATIEFRDLCITCDLSRVKQFLNYRKVQDDIKLLSLNSGTPFNPYYGLFEALKYAHLELAKYMISEGISPIYQLPDNTVTSAIEGVQSVGNTEMFGLLVEYGWDPNRSDIRNSGKSNKQSHYSQITYAFLILFLPFFSSYQVSSPK